VGEPTRTSGWRDDAPHADEAADSSPAKHQHLPWAFVLKRSLHAFTSDKCTDLAAGLTYFSVLSLFPAVLALVSILGLFGQSKQGTDALLDIAGQLAPESSIGFVRDIVQQFVESPAIGWALVIGIAGALWSASGYVGAFGRALNRMYGVEEGRKIWKLRPVQLGVTAVVLVVISLIGVALIVSGPVARAVGSALGLGDTVLVVWSIVKWPIIAVAVVFVIAVLYYATPNVKPPRFRWVSFGAAAALLVLVVASLAFGFYLTNFANYDKTYGSLAGIVIFLLWLWIANNALLYGAELDIELERGRQLASGIRAEERLQVPLRSDDAIRTLADKAAKDTLEGKRVREQALADRED
jgi:membrane protein